MTPYHSTFAEYSRNIPATSGDYDSNNRKGMLTGIGGLVGGIAATYVFFRRTGGLKESPFS